MKRYPRALAGLVVAAAACIVIGCGGGSTGSGGNGGGTGVISDTTRMAAIGLVEAKCLELRHQNQSRDAFNQAMADYLAARPEYEASGVDPETQSAWGRFKDGRLHILANNRDPLPPGTRRFVWPAQGNTRAAELPSTTPARLLHSFGVNFDGQDAITDVGGWLRANGYEPRAGLEGDARVETLRHVSGDGFFYINTHGGRGTVHVSGQNLDLFSLQSSTHVSKEIENIPEYRADLDAQRLTYFTAVNGERAADGTALEDTRYGITASFVERYWSFPTNSVVFVNACYGGNTQNNQAAGGFIFACHKVGAGVYMGWTNVVSSPVAYNAVRYFVSRLLGAKDYHPEDPNQRPFDWQLVLADMQNQGMATDNSSGAQLVGLPRPGGASPQILAPSIETMQVDEYKKELTLHGAFGSDPGKVTVGGAEVTVKSWGTDTVVCDLQPGISGDTIATVRNHHSNVVQLTEWKAHFKTSFILPNGIHKQVGTLDVHFRADVHSHRDKPHVTPKDAVTSFDEEEDSTGHFTASGSQTFPGPPAVTITWGGSSDLNPLNINSPIPSRLVGFGDIDVKQKKINLAVQGIAAQGMTMTTTPGDGPHPLPGTTGHLDGDYSADKPIPVLHLTLNDDFSINGGVREEIASGATLRLEWDRIEAIAPPKPEAARSATLKGAR